MINNFDKKKSHGGGYGDQDPRPPGFSPLTDSDYIFQNKHEIQHRRSFDGGGGGGFIRAHF